MTALQGAGNEARRVRHFERHLVAKGTPFYSERERAALEWTEAVTLVGETHVPDDIFERARQQFEDSAAQWLSTLSTVSARTLVRRTASERPLIRIAAASRFSRAMSRTACVAVAGPAAESKPM